MAIPGHICWLCMVTSWWYIAVTHMQALYVNPLVVHCRNTHIHTCLYSIFSHPQRCRGTARNTVFCQGQCCRHNSWIIMIIGDYQCKGDMSLSGLECYGCDNFSHCSTWQHHLWETLVFGSRCLNVVAMGGISVNWFLVLPNKIVQGVLITWMPLNQSCVHEWISLSFKSDVWKMLCNSLSRIYSKI